MRAFQTVNRLTVDVWAGPEGETINAICGFYQPKPATRRTMEYRPEDASAKPRSLLAERQVESGPQLAQAEQDRPIWPQALDRQGLNQRRDRERSDDPGEFCGSIDNLPDGDFGRAGFGAAKDCFLSNRMPQSLRQSPISTQRYSSCRWLRFWYS